MNRTSVDHTLKSIKDIINSSHRKLSSDVIELTEDDLIDEHDQDAYRKDISNIKKDRNSPPINDFLTDLPHPLYKKEHDMNSLLEDEDASAENAAKSLANIKSILKKVDHPSTKNKTDRSVLLEEIILEALQPLLKDWINKNLPSIAKEVIEKEMKGLISKKIEKND